MRAERDDDAYNRPGARRKEPRLAYEIALGIWLGGVALAATSAVFWALVFGAISSSIRFG